MIAYTTDTPVRSIWEIWDTYNCITSNIANAELYTTCYTKGPYCSTSEVTTARYVVEPQKEDEFDTTELEKYIDSLKKEAVGTKD